MKPFIGVSCNFAEKKDGAPECVVGAPYVDAVRAAEGTPLILPPVGSAEEAATVLEKVDGVLFIGGADIRPQRYGEETHPKTRLISERRETSDFLLVEHAVKRDMPIMAICYGCQMLNVAFGGKLVQDIPDAIKSEIAHAGSSARHRVKIERGTRLRDILKCDEIQANSSHHQAVKTVADPIIVSARADDIVIEAIESTQHRHILGIQWHPERLLDEPGHLALFKALIREASRR